MRRSYLRVDKQPFRLINGWLIMDKLKQFKKNLGKSIARERKKVGLTQEQLSECLGIGNEAISRIERGLVEPNLSRLLELGEALDCSVSNFFEEASPRVDDKMAMYFERLKLLKASEQQLVFKMIDELIDYFLAKK